MKFIKFILGILLLSAGFVSCQDELSVDLADRKYVRINRQSVTLTKGEKITLKANVDSLGSSSKTFNWSVLDPSIASIASVDNTTAILTGLNEGTSVVKIESSDGELKYFSDLSVTSTRTIKILAIGNSFSEDAVENYLYDIAKSAGNQVIIGNLYATDATFQDHWRNASENRAVYELRGVAADGTKGKFEGVTLKQAITGENWDYITFQEVSHLSGKIEGYQQYLPQLVEYVKDLTSNPDVKFLLHQTWAYAEDSNNEGFLSYDNDQMKMYNAIVDAVEAAKGLADIDMIIPVGTAIQNGRTTYLGDQDYLGDLFMRDGTNLSLERGRFLAAATWYETIFGSNVVENPYQVSTLSEYENNLIKAAAHTAVQKSLEITPITAYRYPEGFTINTHVLSSPIYIDFGPRSSSAPFNNYNRPTDPKLPDLKDQNGRSTRFEIGVQNQFSGTLERGLGNDLGFPQTAAEDMFFSDGVKAEFRMSSFALSNFNPNMKYTFVFYGSINDSNTQTEYRVIGKNEGVAYLVNDNNRNRLAVIRDISPTDYGTLVIRLQPGPNNTHWARFYGVNAMIIIPEGYNFPLP